MSPKDVWGNMKKILFLNRMSKVDLEAAKNTVHTKDSYQKLLKKHAVSDAKHDLDKAFTSIFSSYTHIGTPQEKYSVTAVTDGWKMVSEFIDVADTESGKKPSSTENVDDIWVIQKKDGKIVKDTYTFKMKETAFEYTVKVIEIPETLTPPLELFDAIAPGKSEICAIYDFSTGHLLKSLLQQTTARIADSDQRKFTFVINREVLSDPAPKPNEKDKEYSAGQNAKRHVKFGFATDIGKDTVFYPAWLKEERKDFHWDFFSDFDIQLTAIDYNEQNSTILKFSDDTYTNESKINTSQTGKMANSKNAMITLLNYLKDLLTKSYSNPNKTDKDYFISLQKKRSGDSLMVLSFFDRIREYKYKNIIGSEKQHITTFQSHLNASPSELFILTHDTFNTLPISLANGANVIHCGAVSAKDKKQKIYVFRLATEPTDPTQDFYNSFRKQASLTSNTYYIKIKEKLDIYERNISTISLELKAKIQEARKALGTYKSEFDAKSKRAEKDKVAKDAAKDLNKKLRDVYKFIYMYAVYFDSYRASYDATSIYTFMGEILSATTFVGMKEKTEKVRTTWILLNSKEYETIEDFNKKGRDETTFEKEIQKSHVFVEAIPKFEFIENKGVFSVFQKQSRYLFGTVPFIINILNISSNDTKTQFQEFLLLLKDIQDKDKGFKESQLKSSIELWKLMTATFKFPDSKTLAPVTEPLPLPAASNPKEILNEKVTLLDTMGAVIVQEIQGQGETEIKNMDVDTDTTINPYHVYVKDIVLSGSEKIIKDAKDFVTLAQKNAPTSKNESTMQTLATKVQTQIQTNKLEGGGNSQENRLDELLFFRFLTLNALILVSHHDDTLPIDEQDVYDSNVPFLATLLASILPQMMNRLQFVFFSLQMLYYCEEKDEFEKDFKGIFQDAPHSRFFPAIFLELLQLTFHEDQIKTLQDLASDYPKYKAKLKPFMPQIPRQTLLTATNASYVLNGVLRKLYEQQSLLLNPPQITLMRPQTALSNLLEKGTMAMKRPVYVKGGNYKQTRKSNKKERRKKHQSRKLRK